MFGGERKNDITVFDSPLPKRILRRGGSGRVGGFGDTQRSLRPCGSRKVGGFLDVPQSETRNMCLRSEFCNQEDIVEEILLRLPLKSLHRCMSLSKTSRHLISSYSFLQRYQKSIMTADSNVLMGFFHQLVDFGFGPAEIGFLPVSTQGTRLMEQGFDDSLSFLEPATITTRDVLGNTRFSLVASSNGLLLCKKEEFSCDKSETLIRRDYYICNPLTGQQTALPKPPDTILKFEFGTFTCRGEGYPCLDWMTYKVVLGSDIHNSHLQVEIFSSQTGEWVAMHLSSTISYSLMPTDMIPPVMSESETVCLVSHADGYTDGCCVVFDAKQKSSQLQMVNLPRPGFDGAYALLCQSQGRIYMASRMCEVIELWELNEDKWIWDLKYIVKVVDMFFGGFKSAPHFLGLDPSNPAVALVEVDGMNALVDLKKKSYVLTSAYPNIDHHYLWHPYQWPQCAISTQ